MTQKEFLKVYAWLLENQENAYKIKRKFDGIPNITTYVKTSDLGFFLEKLVKHDKPRRKKQSTL